MALALELELVLVMLGTLVRMLVGALVDKRKKRRTNRMVLVLV
jgi:hypothetical protein